MWVLAFFPLLIIGITMILFLVSVPRSSMSRNYELNVTVPNDYDTWRAQTRTIRPTSSFPGDKRWIQDAANSNYSNIRAHHRTHGQVYIRARLPSSSGYLPGYTDSAQPTIEGATKEALKSAADNLVANIIYKIYADDEHIPGDIQSYQQFLKNQVTPTFLEEQQLVLEKVSIPVNLRGREYYHGAALVESSPRTKSKLLSILNRHYTQQHRSNRSHGDAQEVTRAPVAVMHFEDYFMPIVCLGVMILLVGAFLKANEFGKLAWPTRIASLSLLVGLYILLANRMGYL